MEKFSRDASDIVVTQVPTQKIITEGHFVYFVDVERTQWMEEERNAKVTFKKARTVPLQKQINSERSCCNTLRYLPE